MKKRFQFTLDAQDIFQLLDGLKARAKEWDMTAYYLQTNCMIDDPFSILECAGPEEADQIGCHYRKIVSSVEEQIMKQI